MWLARGLIIEPGSAGSEQALADAQLRATLQCIRCGACMNHCLVYTRIGGRAYGTMYPGLIGKIISPHLLGLEATADLLNARGQKE